MIIVIWLQCLKSQFLCFLNCCVEALDNKLEQRPAAGCLPSPCWENIDVDGMNWPSFRSTNRWRPTWSSNRRNWQRWRKRATRGRRCWLRNNNYYRVDLAVTTRYSSHSVLNLFGGLLVAVSDFELWDLGSNPGVAISINLYTYICLIYALNIKLFDSCISAIHSQQIRVGLKEEQFLLKRKASVVKLRCYDSLSHRVSVVSNTATRDIRTVTFESPLSNGKQRHKKGLANNI